LVLSAIAGVDHRVHDTDEAAAGGLVARTVRPERYLGDP
jgi:hypothetical protein